MFKRSAFFIILALSTVSLSGCPGDGAPSAGRNQANAGTPRNRPAAQNVNLGGASLFRLNDVTGRPVTVKTPAALFFFTSWCGYCKQVMPELKVLVDQARRRGWYVYGVDVKEGPAQMQGFIQQYQPNFPILLDQQGAIANRYGVTGYPTFIMIDQNANIIYRDHSLPRRF